MSRTSRQCLTHLRLDGWICGEKVFEGWIYPIQPLWMDSPDWIEPPLKEVFATNPSVH